MPSPKDIPEGHKATKGDGAPISATEGVVPILHELEKGKLQVIGTGFYITRYGLFLSARHVFDHIIESKKPSEHSLRIFHHTGKEVHIRAVKRFAYSHHADIALGEANNFLAKYPDNPLINLRARLTLQPPKKASKLVTFAYPRNKLLDFSSKDDPVEIFADRFEGNFDCIREPGKYDEHQIEAYQTTVPIEGGASGAPVFDEEGRVTAIACSSLEFEGGEHDGGTVSFLTPIRHCLDLGLNNLLLPEQSWEYRQIPISRRNDISTIRDLAAFGHVEFIPPVI